LVAHTSLGPIPFQEDILSVRPNIGQPRSGGKEEKESRENLNFNWVIMEAKAGNELGGGTHTNFTIIHLTKHRIVYTNMFIKLDQPLLREFKYERVILFYYIFIII
jgi:hypothetical protein